jgi:hypothetical protein
LFKNELKSGNNSKENLTSGLNLVQNSVLVKQNQHVGNNRNFVVSRKSNSNTSQRIVSTRIEIPKTLPPAPMQTFIPVKQAHVPQQQFVKQPTRAGWSIFVYNLPPKCDECLLWKLFNPFGPVLYVHVTRDNRTNKCKGYGIVTMTNYEQANYSIYVLNGLNLPGSNKPLQVLLKVNNF